MKAPYWQLALVVMLVAAGVAIWLGYSQDWTGFSGGTIQEGELPHKNLWDWLELLVVPLFLALAAFILERSRKASDRRVEEDRQRQQILGEYFACLTELLLREELMATSSTSARSIARTRTLSALRLLDRQRKAELLQFIYEAGLISEPPVIELNGADFNSADLSKACLRQAVLRGVHFRGTCLRSADLTGANLCGSDFSGADLTSAKLERANLIQAKMRGAQLENAVVTDAQADQADLRDLKPAQIRKALTSGVDGENNEQ